MWLRGNVREEAESQKHIYKLSTLDSKNQSTKKCLKCLNKTKALLLPLPTKIDKILLQPKNPELHSTAVLGPEFFFYSERKGERPRWLTHSSSINLFNKWINNV